jgi:hypothetical protein
MLTENEIRNRTVCPKNRTVLSNKKSISQRCGPRLALVYAAMQVNELNISNGCVKKFSHPVEVICPVTKVGDFSKLLV